MEDEELPTIFKVISVEVLDEAGHSRGDLLVEFENEVETWLRVGFVPLGAPIIHDGYRELAMVRPKKQVNPT